MRRRRPACGYESAHGPHEFTEDRKWDGTVLGEKQGGPWFCAGWTAGEAGLCVMLRQVHLAMIEKAGPGRTFRLEVGGGVAAGLQSLFLPGLEDITSGARLDHVHGAELWLAAGVPSGSWRLAETRPAIAAGTVPA